MSDRTSVHFETSGLQIERPLLLTSFKDLLSLLYFSYMSRRSSRKLLWVVILACILTPLLFQNCSKQNSSQNESLSTGNGTGYGGKLVALPLEPGKLCPDLTNIDSRIVVENSSAKLVREGCKDLTASEIRDLGQVANFSGDTVEISGSTYQLEALLGYGRGQRTANLLGAYAPSMSLDALPQANSVDGVALGDDYILVAFTQGPMDLSKVMNEIVVRLYMKADLDLVLKHEIRVPASSIFSLSDLKVLMGTYAFDENNAVIMAHNTNPLATDSLLIRREGDQIRFVSRNLDLGRALHVQGHSLDHNRFLLTYTPDSFGPLTTLATRVAILEGDQLTFGAPLIIGNPAKYPNGAVSLLATAIPGRFEAYQANTNYNYLSPTPITPTGEKNLVHFTVQVAGKSVSLISDASLVGSASDLLSSGLDFVGNSERSLMFFKVPEVGYMLNKLINGIYSSARTVPAFEGYFLSTMNMMGSENLNFNGRYYFRLPTSTGTRILFLESLDGDPQLFGPVLPRRRDFNVSKLFRAGDKLVLLETDYKIFDQSYDGHIRILSTPP